MPTAPRILYCRCAYAQVVPLEVKDRVLDHLAASGAAFEAVPDLCEMSARRDPRLRELAEGGPLTIAACYPRAIRWLFAAAGAPLPGEGVKVLNMRVDPVASIIQAVGGDLPPTAREEGNEEGREPGPGDRPEEKP